MCTLLPLKQQPGHRHCTTTVIGNDAEKFDMIEVHGVVQWDDNGQAICEVNDENPEFFSVYLHYKTGGVECIADLPTHSHALNYANCLGKRFNWEVKDFVENCNSGCRTKQRSALSEEKQA